MHRNSTFSLTMFAAAIATGPAFAHHVMGGQMPGTFADGFLSGLGHPIIGLDHFAAVIAVGCLAAVHRAGVALAAGFVLAMIAGVALHVQGSAVPAAEILVALSVIGLGALMLREHAMPAGVALALFALVGLLHGYALGETIFGAERTPLYAYLAGLAVIQAAVALVAMNVTLLLARRGKDVRMLGAGIAGVGLVLLVQQIIPAA